MLLAPFVTPARAEPRHAPTHAIAMHGEPRHPAGFDHFAYVNPDAPKGGTIRQAVVGTFDSLNPHIVKGNPPPGLGNVFETLLARSADEPFALYGLLAESVETPDDRGSVTFRLDPAARWHDGMPVTVDDVLFSLDAQRRFGSPNRRLYYGRVTEAVPVGERGVRFVFAPGPDGAIDREMPLIMGQMPIHQAAWWKGRVFDRTTLEPPMGSGPYRVAEVESGRRLVYERVPGYWGRDLPSRRGLFNADRLVYDFYRDNAVALAAFTAGQADVRREDDPARWATGYDGPALRDGRILREELPHSRPELARGLIPNERRPLFGDVRVREALGLATDFAWIDRTFFHDLLTRTASFYPNSELAARGVPEGLELAALEPYRARLPAALFERPFTLPESGTRPALRRALDLLEQAGWRLKDRRLIDRAGRPFAFEILLGDPADERIALEYARSLERLGMTARVRTVEAAQYQTRIEGYDFDMTVRWWASTLSPGNEQLYYFGSAAGRVPGSRNLPGIADAVVDALAASLAGSRTREDLVARARALDRVLLWGHHWVPLFHSPYDRIAHARWVKRPAVTPLNGPVIDAWWVE